MLFDSVLVSGSPSRRVPFLRSHPRACSAPDGGVFKPLLRSVAVTQGTVPHSDSGMPPLFSGAGLRASIVPTDSQARRSLNPLAQDLRGSLCKCSCERASRSTAVPRSLAPRRTDVYRPSVLKGSGGAFRLAKPEARVARREGRVRGVPDPRRNAVLRLRGSVEGNKTRVGSGAVAKVSLLSTTSFDLLAIREG